MDWEAGIEFGRALERLAIHDTRISKLEDELTRAKHLLHRVGLVALIWAAGLSMKLPSETIGEYTSKFLKGLFS